MAAWREGDVYPMKPCLNERRGGTWSLPHKSSTKVDASWITDPRIMKCRVGEKMGKSDLLAETDQIDTTRKQIDSAIQTRTQWLGSLRSR